MCKAIKNSIWAFFLLPTWGNAIVRCSCVNTIAAICSREMFCFQKGDLGCRHINNGALIEALLCTKGGKCKIYGQPESTSWFNSTIFDAMYNNYEETNAVLCSLSHQWVFWEKKKREGKRMYLHSFSFLFLTDLSIMTGSFLISRKLTAPGWY